MSTQTQSFLQGDIVDGKYELRRYLGGSERGPVFQTEFGNLRRQNAAIKLVRVRPGHAELQLSRWRMAANLSHPHLIRILDMGRCELDGAIALYIVTELADENLAQIIPERALTPEETRQALAPLVDALAFMHSRGFVHTRIKPANIMAVGEELKLSSDSILHLAEYPDPSIQGGAYDPPEGTKGGVFPAGDVWSLGVTLTEILTQKLPVWNAGDRKDPVLTTSLPAPFGDIVRRCLRREPKSRWTATDIAAELPDKVSGDVAPVKAPEPERAKPSNLEAHDLGESAPAQHATGMLGAGSKSPRKLAVGVVAAGLVMITVFGMAKLLDQRTDSEKPSISTPQPTVSEHLPEHLPAHPPAEAARPVAKPVATTPTTVKPESKSASRLPANPAPPATVASATRAVDLSASVQSPSTASAGAVLHEVKPEVPGSASATISGTVRVIVRVSVDSSGNVTDAQLAAEGPSHYFANLSLRAARDWKFTPPKVNGAGVASTWMIHFGYTNSWTNISSQMTQ